MLNVDQTMLTPRKLEALVAVFLGGHPWDRAAGTRDKPVVYSVRSRTGDAIQRMVEELRYLGYLTERDRLTVKGYDAIIAHVGDKSRLGRMIDPVELERLRNEREQLEQRIARRREAGRIERERRNRERRNRERRGREHRRKIERIRSILTPELAASLFRFDTDRGIILRDDISDEQLLDAVDHIASI